MTHLGAQTRNMTALLAVATVSLGPIHARAQGSPPNTLTSPTLGATFALIPATTFVIGTDKDGESPRHTVTISRPFYLQTTEVTQAQWRKVMGSNPSFFKNCDQCPVENVGHVAIKEFIARLNTMDKATVYRFPTDAEWELAARAGTSTLYPWGDEAICSKANFGFSAQSSERECKDMNPGRPVKVGSFPPNGWGLYDMYGNVWEEVSDCALADPIRGETIDPVGPSCTFSRTFGMGEQAIVRGNSWSGGSRANPITKRLRSGAPTEHGNIGFRLARTIPEAHSDSALIRKALNGRAAPPKKSYLMYQYLPQLNVYDNRVVKNPLLLPGSFTASFQYPNGTRVDARSSWTVPPVVLRPGTTLTLAVDTDHAMAFSFLDQVVRVQPGPGQTVSILIPQFDASTFLRWHNKFRLGVSIYNDRYISALNEYYYESDERENGVVLPIILRPDTRVP